MSLVSAAEAVRMGAWPGAVAPSVNAAVTAAGNSAQADATALTADLNIVTTVTATTNGVRLPANRPAGEMMVVVNYDDATALIVYPSTGGKINNGTANAGVSVAINMGIMLVSLGSNNWVRVGHLTA